MPDATETAPSLQDLLGRLERLEANVEHLRHALRTLFASHMAHNPPAEHGCRHAAERVAGLQIQPSAPPAA